MFSRSNSSSPPKKNLALSSGNTEKVENPAMLTAIKFYLNEE